MVLQKVSSTKKLRKWQTGHVWLLWRFRGFVKLENEAREAKNKGMQTHWWEKRTHISNRIQDHEKCAPEEMQVKEFAQTVLKMVNKGTTPQQILKELDLERVKNNHHSQ